MLGLGSNLRLTYQKTDYKDFFEAGDAARLSQTEQLPTLFDAVERWLERTPFLEYADGDFQFWKVKKKHFENYKFARQLSLFLSLCSSITLFLSLFFLMLFL